MKKDDQVYLKHIRDAIIKIENYIEKIDYDNFLKDSLVQDGIIRQLEIIGEATKHLSKETKENCQDIPWKDIVGMRDKLIHNYLGVDLKAVWTTIKNDLPILKKGIDKAIK